MFSPLAEQQANRPIFVNDGGRGTISVTNGSAQGLFDQAAFYLVDSGTRNNTPTIARGRM